RRERGALRRAQRLPGLDRRNPRGAAPPGAAGGPVVPRPRRGPLSRPDGGDRPRAPQLSPPDGRPVRPREQGPVALMTSTPSSAPWSPLLDMVRAQKGGEARGIYSICSANRYVLEAGLLEAKADGSGVLIESTSNQGNPLGGYTGPTPAPFVTFLRGPAGGGGLPTDRLMLGGDHLGPFPHASEPAASALDKSREMVRQYVRAGYGKIHLDTSMRCADDPTGALADATVVERAAELCAVAEAARKDAPPGTPAPLYVVGTEVPTPGGEQETQDSLAVTRVVDAARTLRLSREAFSKRGLEDAWERVIALVVQPGVEFGDEVVFDYDRARAAELKRFVEGEPRIVFEAHSTDYQTEAGLRQLVEDHFAILKVGPGLTFAFREAVFAFTEIEREWLCGRKGVVLSDLRHV